MFGSFQFKVIFIKSFWIFKITNSNFVGNDIINAALNSFHQLISSTMLSMNIDNETENSLFNKMHYVTSF